MKLKSAVFSLCLGFLLMACAPKDADIQKEIASKMSDMPEMQVSVTNGVATITGYCEDDACKEKCDNIAKGVKGVKSVVNNCVVVPPTPVAAPVEINSDQILVTSVAAATKAYSGVTASVENGVVTLTGDVKRSQLPGLMQAIQELKPKKVENKLTIK